MSRPGITRSRACRRHTIRALRRGISIRANQGEGDPSILLREVMRNVAQPVAIAVTSVPSSSPLHPLARYHGATLTSFTSLTLHPHPLVAFSLRLPSRMADCLRPWRTNGTTENSTVSTRTSENRAASSTRDTSLDPEWRRGREQIVSKSGLGAGGGLKLPPKSALPWPLSKLPMPEDPPPWAQELFSKLPNPMAVGPGPSPPSRSTSSSSSSSSSTSTSSLPSSSSDPNNTSSSVQSQPQPRTNYTPLTISLLSTLNENIADQLSQPRADHSTIFALPDTWTHADADAEADPDPDQNDGHPPSLRDCVGSLRCQVVGSVRLKDLCGGEEDGVDAIDCHLGPNRSRTKGEGSELFICRVVGVEMGGEGLEPLLHWRRKYAGVKVNQDR
ncbi:hypothetical protein IAR55_007016 [Kwoniella newhampshirensis]|uniref:Flavin reductase like domain-containing protein n=1 Tax=Kwoniella newhampshirensis TaxID=1651941 RepID=A0AAW0YT69_9TREE